MNTFFDSVTTLSNIGVCDDCYSEFPAYHSHQIYCKTCEDSDYTHKWDQYLATHQDKIETLPKYMQKIVDQIQGDETLFTEQDEVENLCDQDIWETIKCIWRALDRIKVRNANRVEVLKDGICVDGKKIKI